MNEAHLQLQVDQSNSTSNVHKVLMSSLFILYLGSPVCFTNQDCKVSAILYIASCYDLEINDFAQGNECLGSLFPDSNTPPVKCNSATPMLLSTHH